MFLLNAVAFAEGLSASSSLPKPLSTISPELCKQSAKQTMSRLNVTPLPSRGPYGPQEELKLFFRMKRALHHTVSQKQTLPRLPPTETCSDTTSVLKAPCVCPARATMLCPPCTGSRPPPRLIWQAPSLSCVQACLLQAQPPITSVSQGTCPSAGDLSYTRHSSLSRIH